METTAVAFDTHKAVKTLRNAGLEYSQAEAVVETTNKTGTVGDLKESTATKEGLANTNRALGDCKTTLAEIKATIATKEDFKTEIDKVLKHLYITSFARTVIALAALVVASGKFL